MENAMLKKITEKYNTLSAFGMDIGWVPQKVHRMVNGEYVPKLSEGVRISRALEISLDELASFFIQ